MLPKSAMQGSHCGEAAPVFSQGETRSAMAVPVVSASGSEERASGGLPNPKGLGVSPSGGASRVGGSPDLSGLASSGVETTGV